MALFWKDVRPQKYLYVDGWQLELDVYTDSYKVWPQDDDSKTTRKEIREANQKGRLIVKGLKKLLRTAKAPKGFFEAAGGAIHGNVNSVESKYRKLVGCCSNEMLIAIGNGSDFTIQSYVDGSYTISVEDL